MTALLLSLLLGYAPPSAVVLHQYGAERALHSAPSHLNGNLILSGDDGHSFAQANQLPLSGDRVELPATLDFAAGRCTLRVGPQDHPFAVVKKNRGQLQGNAGLPASLTELVDLACEPFLNRGATAGDELAAFIAKHGGEIHRLAFTRFDGRVAYAIGGTIGKGAKASVTLSREGLLPLRLQLHKGDDKVDVRLSEYRIGLWGGTFPGRLGLFKTGTEVAAFAVDIPSR